MNPRKAMAFSERWCARSAWHFVWLAPLAIVYGAALFPLVISDMWASEFRRRLR